MMMAVMEAYILEGPLSRQDNDNNDDDVNDDDEDDNLMNMEAA